MISAPRCNVTSGGSDLSTGNLQLGDGLVGNPSLKFVSDTTLGIYKPEEEVLGFVNSGKKLLILEYHKIAAYQRYQYSAEN